MSITVIDIGEDGGRWLATETTDPERARIEVIRHLRKHLLPSDQEVFVAEVEELLDLTPRIYHYPICVHPDIEMVYVESPVGRRAIASDVLAKRGVTFGMPLLPDQRDVGRVRP